MKIDVNEVALLVCLIIAIAADLAGDWYLDRAAEMVAELNNGIRMASK